MHAFPQIALNSYFCCERWKSSYDDLLSVDNPKGVNSSKTDTASFSYFWLLDSSDLKCNRLVLRHDLKPLIHLERLEHDLLKNPDRLEDIVLVFNDVGRIFLFPVIVGVFSWSHQSPGLLPTPSVSRAGRSRSADCREASWWTSATGDKHLLKIF